MKKWKRVLSIVLAICCVCSLNITAFAATGNMEVNVQFNANGGTFDASQVSVTDPSDVGANETNQKHWGLACTVGQAAKYCNEGTEEFHITNLQWDANQSRTFEGWQLFIQTNEGQIPVSDTLYSTAAALNMVFNTQETRVFIAQWSGNDDDYYSQVYIRGYRDYEFEFTNYWMENGQQVSNSMTTSSWGDYLREGKSINEDRDSTFAITKEPSRSDATFEGWLEFKITETDDSTTYELVSDTIYTTAQVVNKVVPKYDVAYVAKWSDIEVSEYFYSGEMYNVMFEGNGGSISYVDNHGTAWNEEGFGWDVIPNASVSSVLRSLSDPVYWNPNRAFKGWIRCAWQEVTDDNGNSRQEIVQVEDKLYTSAEVLGYKVTEDGTIFRAVWDGEDSDYNSNVYINGYGAKFTFNEIHYENNNPVKEERKVDTWGSFLRETNDSIKNQAAEHFEFVAEPVRMDNPDAVFEGWVEFKVNSWGDAEGPDCELVSDTLYTTAQMLNRTVPAYDVMYVAKWSDIPLNHYFKSMTSVVFNSNAGSIYLKYTDENGNIVEEENGIYGMMAPSGSTVKDAIDENGVQITSVKKECAKFTGWTVYTYEESFETEIEAGTERNFGDPDYIIIYSHTYTDDNGKAWDVYLSMIGAEVYSQNLSTEDLYKVNADKNIYAMANWEDTHAVVVDEAVAPTCTATGLTEGSHCSSCHEVIVKQEVVKATGHKMGEWKVTKKATADEEGKEERKCEHCGHTETKSMKRLTRLQSLASTVNKLFARVTSLVNTIKKLFRWF